MAQVTAAWFTGAALFGTKIRARAILLVTRRVCGGAMR